MAVKKQRARAPKKEKKQKIIIGRIKGGELVDVKANARDFILASIGGKSGVVMILDKVLSQALKGSFKHQELLLNYILGKPVERLKLDTFVEKGAAPENKMVLQIIADHVRLDKLHKDISAQEAEVMDPERIRQMEELLNSTQPINHESDGEITE